MRSIDVVNSTQQEFSYLSSASNGIKKYRLRTCFHTLSLTLRDLHLKRLAQQLANGTCRSSSHSFFRKHRFNEAAVKD